MDDLRRRFATLGRVPVPDLWPDIVDRAETVDAAATGLPVVAVRRPAWSPAGRGGMARGAVLVGLLSITLIGGWLLGVGSPAPRGPVGPSSQPSPSVPEATPGGSGTSIDTSAWVPYASARQGLSLRYPTGWTVSAAVAPWSGQASSGPPYPPSPVLDVFTSPSGVVFTAVSGPMPPGLTPEQWLTVHEATAAAQGPAYASCTPPPAGMDRTTVDGQPAWLNGPCRQVEAIVFVGGRVYDVASEVDVVLNRALFDAFLSTITFTPSTANDAAAVGPAATTH